MSVGSAGDPPEGYMYRADRLILFSIRDMEPQSVFYTATHQIGVAVIAVESQ